MGENDRFVSPRGNGKWANQRVGAARATSLHNTQREAEEAARQAIRESGGGELSIQGTDGRIRQKDTVPPAKDPFPPRG